jgi:hypothetical protein
MADELAAGSRTRATTSSARLAGRAVAAAALVSVAALVTACGGSSGSAAPAKTITVTATPKASASATGSATPTTATPATSPTAPAGPSPCATRDIAAKVGTGQGGAAGSTYQVLDFTNISNITCSLYGYPGVSFVTTGTSGGQIGAAATRSTFTAAKLVTLAPGQVANAVLQIRTAADFPASGCHPVTAHWLLIYPPNQTTPIYLSFSSQTCAKPIHILSVSVVVPGSGG